MGAGYFLVRSIFNRRRPDQALEGRSAKITEGGRIRQDGLAKELLTESESLRVAAPAKGFSSIEEIESRESGPGGGFFNNQRNFAGGLGYKLLRETRRCRRTERL